MLNEETAKPNMVVQLAPDAGNPMLAYCMMVITEVKPWGCQGYVQATGTNGEHGGQAYYRAKWEEMEFVGQAVWVAE